VTQAKNRSERERQADINKITGVFTGSYVEHPFTGKQVPIWIGDYVLAGYGTGAVMAVPAHDSRDYSFAKHFGLPILEVVAGGDLEKESYDAKEGKLINSDFLNGLDVKDAMKKAIAEIEAKGLGKGKVNFRLRDAVFGRQRYWGEPIPVYYKNDIPYALNENELPLVLPEVDKYLPTEDGEPPLARAASSWKHEGKYDYEHSTMPGWAGSSWYFLRYMDATNGTEFASKKLSDYWQQVDLYIGGSEHATGHLLYVRFWTKFLKDLGYIAIDEPAKKLINQGMIGGESAFTHRLGLVFFKAINPNLIFEKNNLPDCEYSFADHFVLSKSIADKLINEDKQTEQIIKEKLDIQYKKLYPDFAANILGKDYEIYFLSNPKERIIKRHVHVDYVNGKNELDIENAPGDSMGNFNNNVEFLREEDGKFICSRDVEKMSKSKYNVVTPDDIAEKFGSDTLRLYEMFLGPLEQSKPWNTNGITGVHGFLKKLWKLFYGTGTFAG
jgi:leucyl-tRNA synthetase